MMAMLDGEQSAHARSQERFVWPPKEPEKTTGHTRSPPIEIRLPNRAIESIETHLLGRTGLAFDRWALRTGWTRDDRSAYCWRCAGSIGAHESDGEGCAACRNKALPWDRAIRLGRHREHLRDEVLALKFARWRATGLGLGEHLGRAIAEQLALAQLDITQVVLVPVPMHRLRRLRRGIDHTAVITRGVARSSGCRIIPLLKARYRPEQVGLSMTARAKNIKGAFYCPPRAQKKIARQVGASQMVYILIDDVRTTGATFVAASKALKTGFTEISKPHRGTNPGEIVPPAIWIASIGVAGESRREIIEAQ